MTAHGLRFLDAARRMERCLQEFRVRGVKTNIPFLTNLIRHPDFLAGKCTTKFLDETPKLFKLPARQDRATKVLTYIAEIIVNGHSEPNVRALSPAQRRKLIPREPIPVPPYPFAASRRTPQVPGTRDKFKELGPEKFAQWARGQKRLFLTDTTFRDAHQSLLATRMRTYDMLRVAPVYASLHADLFSLEMWGGATFDTSMRFLKENPWDRLSLLRTRVPNILFQMLLRANNAVGYANYPDNVVEGIYQGVRAGRYRFIPNFQRAQLVPEHASGD